jgi:uncharacterized RDD family membrane protein YckC
MAETDTYCATCGQPTGAAATPGATPPPAASPLSYSGLPPSPPIVPPPYGSAGAAAYLGKFLDPGSGRPLASWGRRFGAHLIDALIIGVPLFFVVFRITGPAYTEYQTVCASGFSVCTNYTLHRGAIAGAGLISALVSVLYFTLLIGSSRGQTVGMMALKIGVRDQAADATIGHARAFVRWLVLFALALAFYLPHVIDCLSPLWDQRRQAWHDHAASSVVVDLS